VNRARRWLSEVADVLSSSQETLTT
jgi:hypothetical protein